MRGLLKCVHEKDCCPTPSSVHALKPCVLSLVLVPPQERNDVLEKAFEECQAQAAHHRDQMAEMQDSLRKATKVLQVSPAYCYGCGRAMGTVPVCT
jgi:hypothetical protein